MKKVYFTYLYLSSIETSFHEVGSYPPNKGRRRFHLTRKSVNEITSLYHIDFDDNGFVYIRKQDVEWLMSLDKNLDSFEDLDILEYAQGLVGWYSSFKEGTEVSIDFVGASKKWIRVICRTHHND